MLQIKSNQFHKLKLIKNLHVGMILTIVSVLTTAGCGICNMIGLYSEFTVSTQRAT